MSLRDVLALPRKVLRREKERMEMTERMGDGARDHECANERVPVCEREEEKKRERHFGLSTLPMFFSMRYHWGRALESDYSRIRMAVLDLEKKHRPERWRGSARLRGGLCRTLLCSLRERENNTKEPRGLDQGRARPRRRIVACRRST